MRSSFRPISIRNLSGFIGEITAYIAGVEVALLEAQLATKAIDEEKWQGIAKKHSIHLGGVTPSSLLQSHYRMSILSIYSAFDSYLGTLKKEYSYFYDKSWVQHDGDSPFEAIRRNCPNKGALLPNSLAPYLTTIDYYRTIRNIVAHPRDDNKSKPDEFYKKHEDDLRCIRKQLSAESAPNMFSHLSFEDIKIFARLVLATADAINVIFTPSHEIIAEKIPDKFQFKNLAHDIKRRRKSIASYLRMEYGLKPIMAEEVADVFLAH